MADAAVKAAEPSAALEGRSFEADDVKVEDAKDGGSNAHADGPSTSRDPQKAENSVGFRRLPYRVEKGLGCGKCRHSFNGCSTCGYFTEDDLREMMALRDARKALAEERRRKRQEKERAKKKDGRINDAVPPFERAKRRILSQISRIRKEMWLLETYEMEGWRGASKEKLKPTHELQRASDAIARAKLIIQENMRFIDEGGNFTSIPKECYTPSGELDEEHIFCAKCLGGDAPEDNDIILCDGYCGRAYHQNCMDPPLKLEDLPPEDEGWLCPSCSAKVDCIYFLNELFNTAMPLDTPWHAIYDAAENPAGDEGEGIARPGAQAGKAEEEAGGSALGFLAMDLPSEESDDEDFELTGSQDPERPRDGSEDEDEDDEEDDGGDGERTPGSIFLAACAEPRAETEDGEDRSESSSSVIEEEGTTSESEEPEALPGKRRRKKVNYRKLNDLMFGETEAYEGELVSDNEWNPLNSPSGAGARLESPSPRKKVRAKAKAKEWNPPSSPSGAKSVLESPPSPKVNLLNPLEALEALLAARSPKDQVKSPRPPKKIVKPEAKEWKPPSSPSGAKSDSESPPSPRENLTNPLEALEAAESPEAQLGFPQKIVKAKAEGAASLKGSTGVKRTRIDKRAVTHMREVFQRTQKPSKEEKYRIAEIFGLTRKQVGCWFASERFKVNKSKEPN